MALVDYSDSEDSGADDAEVQQKPDIKSTNTNFSIDRSNPHKIRINLGNNIATNKIHDDEPAPKRARLGGGVSGFNAMLPPPKRAAEQPPTSKAPARKVFSLKTGAEPGFSRESDAELKQLFDEQDTNGAGGDQEYVGIPDVPKRTAPPPATTSNTFMFKPLSVARNPNKKKKPGSTKPDNQSSTHSASASGTAPAKSTDIPSSDSTPQPKKKVSLFSAHSEADIEPAAAPDPTPAYDEEYPDNGVTADYSTLSYSTPTTANPSESQSLTAIASDLNLSAAERRQLFGRSGMPSANASASNVINFNTDQEYAANEVLRANGETVQHNPVRAIAPGKHSLRQLMTAAAGQKDALEESFAMGKRNKKESGSKYGW